jgi:hypothetical protein
VSRTDHIIESHLIGLPYRRCSSILPQAQRDPRCAREALAKARSTLERALRELDRYARRFEEAESLRDKADVMNGTLNELACNITPNLRLDLIASAQAELVRADTME